MKACLLSIYFSLTLISSYSQSKECIKGDCKNGLGHTEFDNGDFYIGYRTNDTRNGIGMSYYAHSAQNPEYAVFSFFAKKNPRDSTYLPSPKLMVDFTHNQKWLGFASVQDPIKRGIYIDPQLNIFTLFPSGNLPADLSVECLEGDCKEGNGALKFTDSQSIDHFYYGKFKGGKFNGQGIEIIAQTGQVLVGNFVQDNCVEGILYNLEDNVATYYKNAQVVTEFYWEYAPPYIDPAIAANKAALEKAQQEQLAAKKEKRKKFWGDVGLAAAAVALVTTAVVLSDEGSSSTTKKNSSSKSSATNNNSTKTSTSKSSGCKYEFVIETSFNSYGVHGVSISNIYTVSSNSVTRTSGTQPQGIQMGRKYEYFVYPSRDNAKDIREQKKEALEDRYLEKDWDIKNISITDKCQQ